MASRKKKQPSEPILAPDGVPIKINFDKFVVGGSVFIPCMNTTKAKRELVKLGYTKLMRFDISVVIENGKYGIRAWRTV